MTTPNLPPLSTTTSMQSRRSKNPLSTHSGPEWFWKLSPVLPQLWIRDPWDITPPIVTELEAAWLQYQTLSIPGRGEGAKLGCLRRSGRRKLEVEYSRLDELTRRAKEVALARCNSGFVIRGRDGSLDYCTDQKEGKESSGKEKSCFTM